MPPSTKSFLAINVSKIVTISALQKGDKKRAKSYFSEAAKDQGEVGKAAQAQLANLGVTQ